MGEDAISYGVSVGVPLAVFVTVLVILMKSFNTRIDDMKDHFDDKFKGLAGGVKANGEAIEKLSEKVGALSEDVAVIKVRLDWVAPKPRERTVYRTVQGHDTSEETESGSTDAVAQQDTSAETNKNSEVTPSRQEPEPVTSPPLNTSEQSLGTTTKPYAKKASQQTGSIAPQTG